jgi:hypothetical protein
MHDFSNEGARIQCLFLITLVSSDPHCSRFRSPAALTSATMRKITASTGSLYQCTIYEPRLEETVSAPERRFTRDATPASRVKEVFAQFVPNEKKRVKHFCSSATFIQ